MRKAEVCWRKGCCLKIHGVYVKVWSCQKATRPEWVAGGQVALSVRDTSFSPPYLLLFSAKVKTLTSVLCQGSRESIYLGWDAASTTSWHPLGWVRLRQWPAETPGDTSSDPPFWYRASKCNVWENASPPSPGLCCMHLMLGQTTHLL